MAENTYGTYLMKGTTSGGSTTYSKLIDIKDYPDIGGAPEQLETTTLSDKMQTFILGIQQTDSLEFTCNYSKSDYTTLKALEGEELDLAIWFGGTESQGTVTPSGANGKFKFKGSISVHVTGKGVNEVREMVVTAAASTVIEADNS
jgi:hypothetical protein